MNTHLSASMKVFLAVLMIGSAVLILPQNAASDIKKVVRCESWESTPENCSLPAAPANSELKEIRKTKQLSKEPCVEGKSWVAGETGITVRDGCRAEFTVLYRLIGVSERKDRGRQLPTPSSQLEEADDASGDSPAQSTEDPSQIVMRSFYDVMDRRPSREELRYYRSLIAEHGWTERQIRNDLRHRKRSGSR
jgi:hypothetical protein